MVSQVSKARSFDCAQDRLWGTRPLLPPCHFGRVRFVVSLPCALPPQRRRPVVGDSGVRAHEWGTRVHVWAGIKKCRSFDSLRCASVAQDDRSKRGRSLRMTVGREVRGFPLMRDETAHEWGTRSHPRPPSQIRQKLPSAGRRR